MLYKILKVVIRFVLNIFYRKLYVTGIHNINPKIPQLIASNHPNGFMEPLIMACYFPRPLHFLVRGDVFDKKWLRPILIGTNQIPIFRFRDGFSKMRENAQSMDASTKIMIDNNMLLIYAEGSTESIKQLRPLQKGVARIAFSVLEADPDTKLEILPSGVNFSHPPHFGKMAMLRVGAPLKIKDYASLYDTDPKAAYQKLLEDLHTAMFNNVVHLEDLSKLSTLEDVLAIDRSKENLPYLPVKLDTNQRLDSEISIANKVNRQSHSIKTPLHELNRELSNHGYTCQDLTKQPMSVVRASILILGLPLAIIGYLFNIIPIQLGRWFTKSKVSQKEFIACIWMNVTLVFFIIFYLIVLTSQLVFGWPWYTILLGIIGGLWLRFYYDIYATTVYRIAPNQWTNIKQRAQNILNLLDDKNNQ
jgi:glycerol-3-phosphate O-acyltransferase / dihydroxyacetone phosphate acyltransferase